MPLWLPGGPWAGQKHTGVSRAGGPNLQRFPRWSLPEGPLAVCPDQERAAVRASAVSMFGQLVVRAKEADKAMLKKEVVHSLLALLLHLKDRDSVMAMASHAGEPLTCSVSCHSLLSPPVLSDRKGGGADPGGLGLASLP